jgi:hypothetical protein
VYEIKQQNQWGNWDKGSKLAFASWWPVTAPIGLVIGSIALVYGILFKGLFN